MVLLIEEMEKEQRVKKNKNNLAGNSRPEDTIGGDRRGVKMGGRGTGTTLTVKGPVVGDLWETTSEGEIKY